MALFHPSCVKTSFAAALALVGAAFTFSVCLGDAAHAQPAGASAGRPDGGQRAGGQRPQPPQEALAACKSLTSGAACSFTAPQGSVSGSCWAPQNMPLACRPKDGPAAGGHPAPTPKS